MVLIKYVPAGDDQMLGAAFALWSDNIDKSASGLSESDLYWRFFDALPFYAEKTWAATGKEKAVQMLLLNLLRIREQDLIQTLTTRKIRRVKTIRAITLIMA